MKCSKCGMMNENKRLKDELDCWVKTVGQLQRSLNYARKTVERLNTDARFMITENLELRQQLDEKDEGEPNEKNTDSIDQMSLSATTPSIRFRHKTKKSRDRRQGVSG